MNVGEIMTRNPSACNPETKLTEVARIMVEKNCGAVPIVDKKTNKPVGIITDRDITCRTVAVGENPLNLTAASIMTDKMFSIESDRSEEELLRLMEQKQVRRIPVIDNAGKFIGIVSQADVARKLSEHETAELLKVVSKPSARAA